MKKISANYIFDGKEFLQNAVLELDDDGSVISLSGSNSKVIECESLLFYNGIILPGLINMHQHIELSWMHNRIPKQLGLGGFLQHLTDLRALSISPQIACDKMKTLDMLSFKQGIQAVLDISNTEDSIEVKNASQIKYYTAIELFGTDPQKAGDIISKGIEVKTNFENNGLKAILSPHSLYSLSDSLFNMLVNEIEDVISIHFFESDQEGDLFFSSQGAIYNLLKAKNVDLTPQVRSCDDIDKLLGQLSKNSTMILVHCTYITDEIIGKLRALTKNSRIYFCLCPLSNQFISNKLPNPAIFIENNFKIVIGTDSLASNSSLNFIDELIELQNRFQYLKLVDLLSWCTSNAAEALGYSAELGSFKKGMKPGVVLLENIDLHKLTFKSESIFRRLM